VLRYDGASPLSLLVVVQARAAWLLLALLLAADNLHAISSYVKMGRMDQLSRITPATLDVLGVLVEADRDLHGFALAKAAHRPTGSVYLILSRLEEAGWIGSYWEEVNAQNEGRPRRRFYRLTPDGLSASRVILAERRGKPAARGVKRWNPGLGFETAGRARWK
jgi:PadR family transcriptional regulator, regulatory protein PadR